MAEIVDIFDSALDYLGVSSRDAFSRTSDGLGESVSSDVVEFGPSEEGSVFMLSGDRDSLDMEHDGAVVVGAPGARILGDVRIAKSCSFSGLRFDGQVFLSDSSVSVQFLGCVFRYDRAHMVDVALGARAVFVGCRFGPRSFGTGNVIENPAPALATDVNVGLSSNLTGLAIGNVTEFGVTT